MIPMKFYFQRARVFVFLIAFSTVFYCLAQLFKLFCA